MTNRRAIAAALSILTVALTIGSATSVAAKDDKKVNVKQIIDTIHQKWSQAMLAGDCKTLATFYAAKGSLLPPNAPRADGRAAIEQFCTPMAKTNIIIETTEFGQEGATAWALGTYRILGADGKPVDVGKYVEIWTVTDNGWKIAKDIWNSDQPVATAAAKH